MTGLCEAKVATGGRLKTFSELKQNFENRIKNNAVGGSDVSYNSRIKIPTHRSKPPVIIEQQEDDEHNNEKQLKSNKETKTIGNHLELPTTKVTETDECKPTPTVIIESVENIESTLPACQAIERVSSQTSLCTKISLVEEGKQANEDTRTHLAGDGFVFKLDSTVVGVKRDLNNQTVNTLSPPDPLVDENNNTQRTVISLRKLHKTPERLKDIRDGLRNSDSISGVQLNHENIQRWLLEHGINTKLRSFSTANFLLNESVPYKSGDIRFQSHNERLNDFRNSLVHTPKSSTGPKHNNELFVQTSEQRPLSEGGASPLIQLSLRNIVKAKLPKLHSLSPEGIITTHKKEEQQKSPLVEAPSETTDSKSRAGNVHISSNEENNRPEPCESDTNSCKSNHDSTESTVKIDTSVVASTETADCDKNSVKVGDNNTEVILHHKNFISSMELQFAEV